MNLGTCVMCLKDKGSEGLKKAKISHQKYELRLWPKAGPKAGQAKRLGCSKGSRSQRTKSSNCNSMHAGSATSAAVHGLSPHEICHLAGV